MIQQMHHAKVPKILHCLVITWGLTLGSCSPLDIPTGPELSELAQQYDNPDGALPEEEMEEVAGVVREKVEALNHLGNLSFASDTLGHAAEAILGTAKTDGGGLVKLTGVSEVKTPCPGHKSDSSSDDSNGALSFTTTMQDSFIDSTVWGQFEKCKLSHAGVDLMLDSSMDLYLGDPIPLSHLRFNSFLFRLGGEYTLGGRTISLELDFRVLENAVEFRVPVRSGDVVFVLADNLKSLAVRTRSNAFCCDFDVRICSELEGNSCGSAETGTRISW